MHTRTIQEVELLKELFPALSHGEQFQWVLIPELPLPIARFNRPTATILFSIPSAYPQTGPDNFFINADLRLADGGTAPAFNQGSQSSNGNAPVPGDWGWFSWHPQSWRPTATIEGGDNLLGFVRSINLCLRGEESA